MKLFTLLVSLFTYTVFLIAVMLDWEIRYIIALGVICIWLKQDYYE